MMLSDLDRQSLPLHLRSLLFRMRGASNGKATVPFSFLPHLREHANECIDFDSEYFGSSEVLDMSWREVSSLVQQAQWCRLRNDHEAGWNSCVNGPILLLACSLSGHFGNVRLVDLAHVRPKAYLLPSNKEIRKKRVDLGLVIHAENADPLSQFYYRRDFPCFLDGDDFKAWNHSASQQIAKTPLVVSIATKRHGDGGAEADLQLGTWTFAHPQRLLELRKATPNTASESSQQSVFLPQIKIHGACWTLMLVRGDFDPTAVNVHDSLRVTLYTGFALGDVTTYSGFFRVLTSLIELVRWINVAYRPSLHRWVGLDLGISE